MKFRLSFSLKHYRHAKLITALEEIEDNERADFLLDLAAECLGYRQQSDQSASKVSVVMVNELPKAGPSLPPPPSEVLPRLSKDERNDAFGKLPGKLENKS